MPSDGRRYCGNGEKWANSCSSSPSCNGGNKDDIPAGPTLFYDPSTRPCCPDASSGRERELDRERRVLEPIIRSLDLLLREGVGTHYKDFDPLLLRRRYSAMEIHIFEEIAVPPERITSEVQMS